MAILAVKDALHRKNATSSARQGSPSFTVALEPRVEGQGWVRGVVVLGLYALPEYRHDCRGRGLDRFWVRMRAVKY